MTFAYRRDDFAAADQYYEYIFANNKDMDQPFGPWSGFNLIDNSIDHNGELNYLYYGFGNYNRHRGNPEAAIAAYEKALEIRPGYTFVQVVLDVYKAEINQ